VHQIATVKSIQALGDIGEDLHHDGLGRLDGQLKQK
jgi:hypothetical protein